jgi:pimeloyl-ACP methyl ester carboxylesterase
MPAVFVHGVPDTERLWNGIRSRLARTDTVALSLPGFGCDVPPGFAATKEAYVDWLIAELTRVGEPVDLVGHDWGANLVQRAVSLRPDLVRTWACGSGIVDVEYVWHEAAQQFQTPGVGEMMMELMTPAPMTEMMVASGIPADEAAEVANRIDARMKDCILTLYRSAVEIGAEWQPGVDRVTRPALVFWGADDPYGAPRFAERLAARVGGEAIVFPGCGHWWPIDRAAEAAAALERFWR